MFHKVQHQFNGYSMFGIIHHYWSSCFIKYNTNSVEMWLISLYVLTQFYSVAIFNWEKRMCRQDFGFIEYPLCHWPRKQMKNEIKIMRMRYRIIDTPFFCAGDFDPTRLICFFGGLNHHCRCLVCIESKVFFLISLPSWAGSALFCQRGETVHWDEASKAGKKTTCR